MTTLEYMERILNKSVRNLEAQEKRNAPKSDIENIKIKIGHYEKVCNLLREVE